MRMTGYILMAEEYYSKTAITLSTEKGYTILGILAIFSFVSAQKYDVKFTKPSINDY